MSGFIFVSTIRRALDESLTLEAALVRLSAVERQQVCSAARRRSRLVLCVGNALRIR